MGNDETNGFLDDGSDLPRRIAPQAPLWQASARSCVSNRVCRIWMAGCGALVGILILLAVRKPSTVKHRDYVSAYDSKPLRLRKTQSEVASGVFLHFSGYNCWSEKATRPLSGQAKHFRVQLFSDCQSACQNQDECNGFIYGHKDGSCWLRDVVDLAQCGPNPTGQDQDYDIWVKASEAEATGATTPAHAASKEETATNRSLSPPVSSSYFHLHGYNCWSENASKPMASVGEKRKPKGLAECKAACDAEASCGGFIIGQAKKHGNCWLRSDLYLPQCAKPVVKKVSDWDFWRKASPSPKKGSEAPMHEFYMYRAAADGMLGKFPFGEVNTGSIDGVMWYLMNEIVSNYSHGVRCPRRFGISKIHRFKVKMKATAELYKESMNFGVRFAYDQGMCQGRCFPGNVCTGEGDCVDHYDKYGFVPGCNTFSSKYPFPVDAAAAPNGVWYSMPLEGRCDGEPTGDKDCTWSYEYAGNITLTELENNAPGHLNCCQGVCTDFWHDQFNPGVTGWRSGAALWLFKTKYPNMKPDLQAPPCDFDQSKWYEDDWWPRSDPWR